MTYSKWEFQNIALAAVVQSATLVDNLAVRGSAEPNAIAAVVKPLMNFTPASVAELYPNVIQLSLGLRTLQEIFGHTSDERKPEIIRYLLGILALRQKLMSDEAMQSRLQKALKQAPPYAGDDEGDASRQEFYQQVARIYQETISSYSFRIHVKGNLEFLRNENIANQVRTLLLAGIRSAVLWYQIGGRRWHLVLYRKKISQTAGGIRRNLLSTV